MASTFRFEAGRAGSRIDIYRRLFDAVVSSVLLALTLPVILVAAVGSMLVLRASPFFVQERVGRNGDLFRFIKVRTLPPEVPAYTDKHQLDHARIPGFCRALRRLHLDELPQLALVVCGRMSLVGPRPEMAYLHEQLPPTFAALRTSTRPGCTGLWQISESCTELIAAAPEYDRYYLEQRTLRLDAWVLARTAMNMLGVGRCVTLDTVPSWAIRRDALVGAEATPDLVIDIRDDACEVVLAAPSMANP